MAEAPDIKDKIQPAPEKEVRFLRVCMHCMNGRVHRIANCRQDWCKYHDTRIRVFSRKPGLYKVVDKDKPKADPKPRNRHERRAKRWQEKHR